MDKLKSMTILLKVVEAGSLSAAAKQLGLPLATVSRRVAELEAHLKTRMLNRTSRRLSLTEAGRLYVAACRRILEQVDEAERAAAGIYRDTKGQLSVTAPIVFGRIHMVPVISEFLTQYPDIEVKLILADRLLDLLEADIDIALRIGDLSDGNLVAANLGSVRRITCASPDYLAENGRPATPVDLERHICVTFDNLASPEAWRFQSLKGDMLVPIRSRLTVTTAEAALAGAVAGLGLTRLLSYMTVESERRGEIEVVLQDYELSPWPVNLIYIGQQMLPQKVRAFLDFAAPRLRARLAA